MNDLAAHLVKEWEHECFTVATDRERWIVASLIDINQLDGDLNAVIGSLQSPSERHLARFAIEQLTELTTDVTS